MIQVYSASTRHKSDLGWLTSYYSFSYGDYYDPSNMNFGVMRVFNDETIQAKRGFGSHPHREMEIVTLVLRGKLKHENRSEESTDQGFGEVHRLSAGTGVLQWETNPGEEEAHVLRMWFVPQQAGGPPSSESTQFDPADMRNALLPVVSSRRATGVASIRQDLTVYLSELDPIRLIGFAQKTGRRLFLYVLEGMLTLNGTTKLGRRDSARIEQVSDLNLFSGREGAKFVLVDMP